MQNYPFIFKIKNNYLLKKELLKNYTNLILFPYSKTVEDLIKFNNFLVRDHNIIFYDENKKGKTIFDINVTNVIPNDFLPEDTAVLILDVRKNVINKGKEIFKHYKYFLSKEIFNNINLEHTQNHLNRKIFFYLPRYVINYDPFFVALKDENFDYTVLTHSIIHYCDPEIRENILIASIDEIVNIILSLPEDSFFIYTETEHYYEMLDFWNKILPKIQAKKGLILYDIFNIPQDESDLSNYFSLKSHFMNFFDFIIYKDITTPFRIKNFFKLRKNIKYLFFPRYNFWGKLIKKKLSDGIHIVSIANFYPHLLKSAKKILQQEIHFHFYCITELKKITFNIIEEFINSLTPTERTFFHLYSPIYDQKRLIYEISKYHYAFLVDPVTDIIQKK